MRRMYCRLLMPSARPFPIPMRGNERNLIAPNPQPNNPFPIPMRGNERNCRPAPSTCARRRVSDPHEG